MRLEPPAAGAGELAKVALRAAFEAGCCCFGAVSRSLTCCCFASALVPRVRLDGRPSACAARWLAAAHFRGAAAGPLLWAGSRDASLTEAARLGPGSLLQSSGRKVGGEEPTRGQWELPGIGLGVLARPTHAGGPNHGGAVPEAGWRSARHPPSSHGFNRTCRKRVCQCSPGVSLRVALLVRGQP